MCKAVYILGLFVVTLALVMSIWGGGICVLFIFGCCFVGICLLIHYIHGAIKSIKGLMCEFANKIKEIKEKLWSYCKSININWKYVGIFLIAASLSYVLFYMRYDSCGISTISGKLSIPLIISLIAMAAPLIIHNINGLDTKYHGTRIIKVFKESFAFKFFIFCSCFVAVCVIIKLCSWDKVWSNILFIISSLALLIAIVYLCVNLIKFYDYQSLTSYITKQYNSQSANQENNESLFYALIDCLCYSIAQDDKQHTKDLLAILNGEFASYRSQSPTPQVEYPLHYYSFIQEVTEFICRNNYTHILQQDTDVTYALPMSCLFPGKNETANFILSEKSFNEIWKSLLLLETYNQSKLYISYWECAQMYYSNRYYAMGKDTTKQFIAFQEKFGALLLANKHYAILHDIILWTRRLQKKKNNFDPYAFFYSSLIAPLEKLIELEPEKILPRYIYLMYMLDKDNSDYDIPNITSTQEMPRPLKEYCIRYMSLLYLWATKANEGDMRFQYDLEDEIDLPEEVTTDTIEKQVKDLERAANVLIKDDQLTKAFQNISITKSVASPMHFVEVVRERNKLNLRISDISENVYREIDSAITNGCKQAFDDIPIQERKNNSKQTMVKTGIYFPMLILKSDVNEKAKIQKICIDIKAHWAYNVVNEMFKSFQKIPAKIDTHHICKKEEFLSQLEKRIRYIKKKENYTIVCDDSRIQGMFKTSVNYRDKKYMGIKVACNHYSYESTTCNVWILNKKCVPTYTLEKQKDTLDLYGYKFKQLNEDAHYCERLLLDLGRVPTEVYQKLKEDFLDRTHPRKNSWEEFVMMLIMIPIRIYIPDTTVNTYSWQITDLPNQVDEWDGNEECDYHPSKEEIIQNATITPEEHNKYLK